jgi:predicted RNase H-like HicB family nuclease
VEAVGDPVTRICNILLSMRYAVVVERAENNFSAYVPDLPGCIATAESREEVLELIREAVDFHLEGMREAGEEIPQPTT